MLSNNTINRWDYLGLDWLDNVANFAAGAADVISCGVTNTWREQNGYNDVVDKNSKSYIAGEVTGHVYDATLAVTGAGLAGAAVGTTLAKTGVKAATVEAAAYISGAAALMQAEEQIDSAIDRNADPANAQEYKELNHFASKFLMAELCNKFAKGSKTSKTQTSPKKISCKTGKGKENKSNDANPETPKTPETPPKTPETPMDSALTPKEAGISDADAKRIQNAANKTNQDITVVGSRAEGSAGANSDWDYILSGNAKARHSATSSLPRGSDGGALDTPGADFWQNYTPGIPSYNALDTSRPYVTFKPNGGK